MTSQKNSVLIIDYDHYRKARFQVALEKEFMIFSAGFGQEGLAALQKTENHIKVVLLSLELQDMPAIQLIKEIIYTNPLTQIIAYSELDSIDLAVEALDAGAYNYLHEPFQLEMLPTMIVRALEEARSFHEILTGRKLIDNKDAKQALIMAREIMAKRRIEGKAVTAQELFCLLPRPEEAQKEEGYQDFLKMVTSSKNIIVEDEIPTILIIEDFEDVLNGLKLDLQDDFNLLTASSAYDALKVANRAKAEGKKIDVILQDVFLPVVNNVKLNGVELMPSLQQIYPEAEIIIITAYKVSEIAVQAYHNGAAAYLNKPFPSQKLLNAIAIALQSKYRKQSEKELNKRALPFGKKVELLEDYYLKCIKEKKQVSMTFVYCVFPELDDCGKPDDELLPNDITHGQLLDWLITNCRPVKDG